MRGKANLKGTKQKLPISSPQQHTKLLGFCQVHLVVSEIQFAVQLWPRTCKIDQVAQKYKEICYLYLRSAGITITTTCF